MNKVFLTAIVFVIIGSTATHAEDFRCSQLRQLASLAHIFTSDQVATAQQWYASNCYSQGMQLHKGRKHKLRRAR